MNIPAIVDAFCRSETPELSDRDAYHITLILRACIMIIQRHELPLVRRILRVLPPTEHTRAICIELRKKHDFHDRDLHLRHINDVYRGDPTLPILLTPASRAFIDLKQANPATKAAIKRGTDPMAPARQLAERESKLPPRLWLNETIVNALSEQPGLVDTILAERRLPFSWSTEVLNAILQNFTTQAQRREFLTDFFAEKCSLLNDYGHLPAFQHALNQFGFKQTRVPRGNYEGVLVDPHVIQHIKNAVDCVWRDLHCLVVYHPSLDRVLPAATIKQIKLMTATTMQVIADNEGNMMQPINVMTGFWCYRNKIPRTYGPPPVLGPIFGEFDAEWYLHLFVAMSDKYYRQQTNNRFGRLISRLPLNMQIGVANALTKQHCTTDTYEQFLQAYRGLAFFFSM